MCKQVYMETGGKLHGWLQPEAFQDSGKLLMTSLVVGSERESSCSKLVKSIILPSGCIVLVEERRYDSVLAGAKVIQDGQLKS